MERTESGAALGISAGKMKLPRGSKQAPSTTRRNLLCPCSLPSSAYSSSWPFSGTVSRQWSSRAGSPPTAFEILYRHAHDYGIETLRQLLYDWERWSAELLESHLSFPVLAYYRSQHDNQSWLSALTAVLDVSALVFPGIEGACEHQAQLTFAMARHAVVDLAFIFKTPPRIPDKDRLSDDDLLYLRNALATENVNLKSSEAMNEKLGKLRRMYEPYVYALSRYLYLALPPWISDADRMHDWQKSAWDRLRGVQKGEGQRGIKKDHF
jgi:hypothetical protein